MHRAPSIVPSEAARPLRWWSDASLDTAATALAVVGANWCARWGLAVAEVQVFNASADLPLARALQWRCVEQDSIWIAFDAGSSAAPPETALGEALFGIRAGDPSPIALDVASQALADLMRLLRGVTLADGVGETGSGDPPTDGPPAADQKRWSGALRIRLSVVGLGGRLDGWLHFGAVRAAALCGKPAPLAIATCAPLVPVGKALALRVVTLKVDLDPLTLTLGALQSLRLGDVLALPHALDRPLHVTDIAASPGAPAFCAAYLGSRGSKRAVELVSAAELTSRDNA